jgi:hypothetical protein
LTATASEKRHRGAAEQVCGRPIFLTEVCLMRCAQIHQEARILTFDDDFGVYRWARNREFRRL